MEETNNFVHRESVIYTVVGLLYKYREIEGNLIIKAQTNKKALEIYHKHNFLKQIEIEDITNLVFNSYNNYRNSILKCGLDLMYLKGREDGKLYISAFFISNILGYRASCSIEIIEVLQNLLEALEHLADYLGDYPKYRAILNSLRYGDVYAGDKNLNKQVENITSIYKEYLKRIDKLYYEDPLDDYLEIVKRRFIMSKENSSTLEILTRMYELDADFLRNINKEEKLEELRQMYLDYAGSSNLPTEYFSSIPSIRCFVKPQKDLLNIEPYLKMSNEELSRELLKLQIYIGQKIINDKSISSELMSILKDVGLDEYLKIDENFKYSSNSGNTQPKKMT